MKSVSHGGSINFRNISSWAY